MMICQASMEPPMFDIHMNIPAWPGLIAAIGVLTTRVSALEVTPNHHTLTSRSKAAISPLE